MARVKKPVFSGKGDIVERTIGLCGRPAALPSDKGGSSLAFFIIFVISHMFDVDTKRTAARVSNASDHVAKV